MAALLLAAAMTAAPAVAAIQGCPEASPTYFDSCGPTFTVPAWGDAGGWTNASKSSTIQLADINGDGKDELIARNDQGLEIYWFDTSVGQWRPQVDANGVQQVLTDFASPAPGATPATDWTKPEYYSTIQTAHINGNKEAQILARFADGMRVYYFTPGPGGSINGGSWSLISSHGPFSDANGWNDPSQYLSIRTGDIDVSDPGKTELIGRSPTGLVGYKWNGSGWSPLPVRSGGADTAFSNSNCGADCYSSFRMARLCSRTAPSCPTGNQALVGHSFHGVDVEVYNSAGGGSWSLLPGSADRASSLPYGVFSDILSGGDCPLPGFSSVYDCFGSSPSYYATFGVGDIDGDGIDEIYARGPSGLMVRKLNVTTGTWTALPTLTDLGGDGSSVNELAQAGLWGSIRTADLDGAGKQHVLALTNSGLQVWSYDPTSTSWHRWTPSTPLQLSGWTPAADAEYWATIKTGDVNGDGRDDLIARGPYGIRTWFYDRRHTGGWERYLPGGYPDFPSRPCSAGVTGPCGQQAAFGDLNDLALRKGAITSGHIRDVWTMNTPDPTTLSTLQNNLAGSLVGNCSNETNLSPPTYASCVPPSASSKYDASEWTAVVNEMLSEAYSAEQVVDQFNDLNTIRQAVFESESGSLPAIANDLQLAGAAGNTADFNLQGFFAGATGIAASIAGGFEGGGELSAGLWVASELISMLPSASSTANSSFQTTYSGLLDKFATAQDEMRDAWSSQQQQVLGDQGLLSLVGQLHSRRTWKLDINGMLSASRESFALQTYQALLPTMYDRYVITNCTDSGTVTCDGTSLPSGPYVTNHSGTSATFLGPPDANPCYTYYGPVCDYSDEPGTIPDSLASTVWGPSTCNYVPGNPNTLWHYGCALGVPSATSIATDSPGWTFSTESGNPAVGGVGAASSAVSAKPGVVRAGAAIAGSSPRTAQRGSSAVVPRDTLGPLRFSGRVFFSNGLRLRRMRVVVERTLFEHGRREELALSRPGRPISLFALRHVRDGLFATRRSGARVRLNLRRLDPRGGARLDLQLTVRTRDIRVLCGVLPASVSLESRPLELETRLRLRDRGLTERIIMRQRWRCVRDRMGEFVGIAPVKRRPPTARPGLAMRVRAPLARASGRRASILVTVTDRRQPRSGRVVSSLWNLRITGTAGGPLHTIRLKELRARHSRTVRLTLSVPASARGQVCVRVTASADSARPANARRCARVARTAPIAGLAVTGTSAAARERPSVTAALDQFARVIEARAMTL
jgi:hypothetical protein